MRRNPMTPPPPFPRIEVMSLSSHTAASLDHDQGGLRTEVHIFAATDDDGLQASVVSLSHYASVFTSAIKRSVSIHGT